MGDIDIARNVDTETAIAEAGPYRLRHVSLASAGEATLSEWRSFRAGHPIDMPMQDLEWLRGYFASQIENVWSYFLYRGQSLCGIASFILRHWPVKLHLGEFTLAELPLRRLRLLGGRLDFPEEREAYDSLFRFLAQPGQPYNAVFLEEVPIDSFLWEYIQASPVISTSFTRYMPESPSAHLLIRVEGSFEQYMQKFSAKRRKNFRRELRILEEEVGPIRMVRYTEPKDVSPFLDTAVAISRKTYQWRLHKRGLYATELVRERLSFDAAMGWFRAYILFCKDVPLAFLMGQQCGGRLNLDELGFDPAFEKFSPGTLLQLLAIEDIFGYNPPRIYDLNAYGEYKERMSTDSYMEGKVFLFRRGLYPRFVRESHRLFQFMSRTASGALDRLGLKRKLKKALRRSSAAQ